MPIAYWTGQEILKDSNTNCAIYLFLIAFIGVILGSLVLYHNIIRIGSYFRFSDKLIGLTETFSADTAEIVSSFTAFFNRDMWFIDTDLCRCRWKTR